MVLVDCTSKVDLCDVMSSNSSGTRVWKAPKSLVVTACHYAKSARTCHFLLSDSLAKVRPLRRFSHEVYYVPKICNEKSTLAPSN